MNLIGCHQLDPSNQLDKIERKAKIINEEKITTKEQFQELPTPEFKITKQS